MCFYRSGQGKIYSDRELNFRGFLVAKRKYPRLSAHQYHERLAVELCGLVKLPFSTVSELCANRLYEDAAALYAKCNDYTMEQARFAVSLLCADGRC